MTDKDFIGGEPIAKPGRIASIAEAREPFMVSVGRGDLVRFDYLNYRGELSEREVEFHSLRFGCNEYYPEPTWFLHGLDVVKKAERSFAFNNIQGELKGLAYGCGSCRQSVGHSSTCAFKPQVFK